MTLEVEKRRSRSTSGAPYGVNASGCDFVVATIMLSWSAANAS